MTAKSTSSAGPGMPELHQSVNPRRARRLWEALAPATDTGSPRPSESEGEFMARCVGAATLDGETSHEEATGLCSRAWKRAGAVREAVVVTLQEAVAAPPGRPSLEVPREVMPQIPHDKLPAYISWLLAQGVSVELRHVPPSNLKPTQGEVETDKVEKIRAEGTATKAPLVASAEDGRILDGLHRWAALMEDAADVPIPVYLVGMGIGDLVLMTHSWPGVERRDVADRPA